MSRKHLVNKRILITGGAGFIGSFLCERLVAKNKITVFDTLRRNALIYTSLKNHPHLTLIQGDVLNQTKLSKVVKGQDIVIHLAAIAGVSSYYENPLKTLEVDAWGTYGVLQTASEQKIQQVILFSTSEVYGPYANNVTEESLTVQGPAIDSRWSYSVGKLVGDHFAFAFSKMKKLNITIVRPFNIYGPRQVGEGAIQIFIKQALKDQNITIRGDGNQTRAWCYIDDMVDAVMEMINNPKAYNQIFNIGNPNSAISVKNLVAKILRFTHSKGKITYIKQPFTDVIDRKPNIHKARKMLGFSPIISLDSGLHKAIEWFNNT